MNRALSLSVVSPAYNEEAALAATLEEWATYLSEHKEIDDWEIVVCDDGSSDATPAVLSVWASRYPQLTVVTHDHNRGAGVAIATAIAASRLDWVAIIDSDGQFPIANLDRFFPLMHRGSADALSGWRTKKADTLFLRLGSWSSGAVANFLHRTHYHDYNSIFKVARGPLLRSLRLESRGMNCSTELTARLGEIGAVWHEIPIEHRPRPSGTRGWRVWKGARDRALFVGYLGYRRLLLKLGVLRSTSLRQEDERVAR
ncbi:glycosyltransferase family 2 protein [Microbacterium sp. NPDC087665]|uniref:glycosyltransferase family 2 protein n=1 Tax=Microbacterium sp. NPDC087665 TaxID=3364194 RepID=UPI0038219A8D